MPGNVPTDSLALRLRAPKLEALRRNSLFDRPTGEVMRRRLAGLESPGQAPRPIFRRELAAGLIARKSVKVVFGLGNEHENTHGTGFRLRFILGEDRA